MPEVTIQQAFEVALQCHRAGRESDAEAVYRQILAVQPENEDALHLLGVLAAQGGRHEIAVELISRALSLRSKWPEAQNNLGLALKGCGRLDDSIAALRQAVALDPGRPESHNNLGNALKERGKYDEAVTEYRQAIALRPNYLDAHNNLGNALRESGQVDAAIDAFCRAIALDPNHFEIHNNLAHALKERGRLDYAISAYRQAISLKPDYPELHNSLGNAQRERGLVDDAVEAYRRAIGLQQDYAEAYGNLANALKDKAELDEAIAAYRQGMAANPRDAVMHGNLLLALLSHPDFDSVAIASEHRQWNLLHGEGLNRLDASAPSRPGPAHFNDRNPDRRLRVGYVSADFLMHPSAHFLVPLFEHHDRQQVELICYSHVRRPDEITRRLQRVAQWRSTIGVSDEQVAKQVRDDGIDILVDLKLHSCDNRLLVFAKKPAPVQVTWLGYPGTTGLKTIDYRLSDPYLDPTGMDESIYSERTVRLPETFWCYDPLDGRKVPVNSLPALEAGYVTFGCLNYFGKINDGTLDLWATILRQVDNSRLLLLAAQGSHRQRTLDRLAGKGIDPARIKFVNFRPHTEYLGLYHRIDVGLDSFPYNGHTTSLDSFWMGVPVITLVGLTAVARAGWCLLSNLGLGELAATSPEQFVRIAVDLANDLPRLKSLRSVLRSRIEASPLMDAQRFAGNIESAYRRMWRDWCATAQAGG
ncbi:MAG: tetratricopeptide repeat protein [Tepidisphaeraceae bacterium]|jgi:predicted O-linked N-acetylglucosamine transferase (SPINDLY family)